MSQPPPQRSKSPTPKIVLERNPRLATDKAKSEYQELRVSSNYAARDQPLVTIACPTSGTKSKQQPCSTKQYLSTPKYHKTASYTWSPNAKAGSPSTYKHSSATSNAYIPASSKQADQSFSTTSPATGKSSKSNAITDKSDNTTNARSVNDICYLLL